MLRGWLAQNIAREIHVIDPSPLDDDLANNNLVTYIPAYDNTPIISDVFVLAVKPQNLKDACASLSKNLSPETALLSIAAGQSLTLLESIFGENQPIIRTMPNLPASIGKGMSVSIANTNANDTHKKHAEIIYEAIGKHEWLAHEDLMDAATAIVGNGPAYVFYLIEALSEACVQAGLPEDLAMTLVRQVVIGGAALAEHETDKSAATLRTNVTSPGGTTEAALKVMMDGRFQDILNDTIKAGRDRSIELNT